MSYVYSRLLYGVEAGTLKVSSINKLAPFCDVGISQNDAHSMNRSWKITNPEVLHRMNKDQTILESIKKQKTAYLGQVMRQDKYRFIATDYRGQD